MMSAGIQKNALSLTVCKRIFGICCFVKDFGSIVQRDLCESKQKGVCLLCKYSAVKHPLSLTYCFFSPQPFQSSLYAQPSVVKNRYWSIRGQTKFDSVGEQKHQKAWGNGISELLQTVDNEYTVVVICKKRNLKRIN